MAGNGYRLRPIDILALIAVLVVAIALLAPAVQMARTPARRSECAARLGQLASATQQFEIAKKRYPGLPGSFWL